MTPERPHASPYPDGMERRVSNLEGWRGTVDEWRRGMDAWRSMIDREGLVTAVAVIGTKLDRQHDELTEARIELREVKRKVESVDDELSDARSVRRGVTLTGRTIAVFVGAGAGLATIIGLLVAILTGGGS